MRALLSDFCAYLFFGFNPFPSAIAKLIDRLISQLTGDLVSVCLFNQLPVAMMVPNKVACLFLVFSRRLQTEDYICWFSEIWMVVCWSEVNVPLHTAEGTLSFMLMTMQWKLSEAFVATAAGRWWLPLLPETDSPLIHAAERGYREEGQFSAQPPDSGATCCFLSLLLLLSVFNDCFIITFSSWFVLVPHAARNYSRRRGKISQRGDMMSSLRLNFYIYIFLILLQCVLLYIYSFVLSF